jgi:hypothetical protein
VAAWQRDVRRCSSERTNEALTDRAEQKPGPTVYSRARQVQQSTDSAKARRSNRTSDHHITAAPRHRGTAKPRRRQLT